MNTTTTGVFCVTLVTYYGILCIQLPGTCKPGQYLDTGTMMCQICPVNASMTVAADGFGCTCTEQSIQVDMNRCMLCNATSVLSSDGSTCVPRKCQNNGGRIVCRKCSSDYITVTQNLDGTPTKEVLCIKCARGYKRHGNSCVKCQSCSCAKNELAISDACISKKYLTDRPKDDGKIMHATVLANVIKLEYLCVKGDVRACRSLSNECVRQFYLSDAAGPCRLWTQPNKEAKGLPQLTIETAGHDKDPGEIILERGKNSFLIFAIIHTSMGGVALRREFDQESLPFSLPTQISVGKDVLYQRKVNMSQLLAIDGNATIAPYLYTDGDYKPIPVKIRTPSGYYVQRGSWASSNFRRYFLLHSFISPTTNKTSVVFLNTLIVRLRIQRDKSSRGSLRTVISVETHYASKSSLSSSISMTLKVENEMPTAGILRGLEILGGVLAAMLTLYAGVQWRGNIRRGGLPLSGVPILAGTTSDTLYFAALFTTIHALAAEAGTLGTTLPLSHSEEQMIKAFVYSAISLKVVRVAWVNYKQSVCDVFLLNWADYNPPLKETIYNEKTDSWRYSYLWREWASIQVKRRASPGVTTTLALIILYFITPWQSHLLSSPGYTWSLVTIVWWSAYAFTLLAGWGFSKLTGSSTDRLVKVCHGVGMSLLVFEEEYYAHYVHGRNDDPDARNLSGTLATCRVICASQLRNVYKQLSSPGNGDLGINESRQALLSRFLAAFFERALDGLSWVANERSVLERILNVELVSREAGNTSVLLYDPEESPSCFAVTWWGEEWTLATFDAMLFGSIAMAANNTLIAALSVVLVWQVMLNIRMWIGNRRENTNRNQEPILKSKY